MNEQIKMRLGIIGLGSRALDMIKTIKAIDSIEITALCDVNNEYIQEALCVLGVDNTYIPFTTVEYRHLLDKSKVDSVIIMTSWNEHVEITIAAMEAGIPCGFEVGGASSIEQCWDLIRTYEKTKTPCMMLENCCFGRYELAVLQMVRSELFGEIIHCEGGYHHNLSQGVINSLPINHQRAYHHLHRNGDLYPTHEVGPISKYLNINYGNRFVSLASFDSKSVSLNSIAGKTYSDGTQKFMLGDYITTVIKCANGETVKIAYDTSLPRPYSRGNIVQGTKGIWMEINNSIYIQGKSPDHNWENIDIYMKEYEHPLWKKFLDSGVQGGHGGMDYLQMKIFADCIINSISFPIDIYDSATWMAVTVLSEQSISIGGAPLPFPDFTNGKWVMRKPGTLL